MPKFLVEARYTAEGAKAVAHEGGTSRRKAVEEMLKGVNGSLEALPSPMISRSNWAKENSTFSIGRPADVVVEICWVTLTRPTFRASKTSAMRTKSSKLRLN